MRVKTSRILTVLFLALTTIIAAAFASFAMDYDQQIKPTDSFSGSFDSINKTMTYKVELTSSGKLSLNMHLDAKNIEFRIYDSSGSRLPDTFHVFRKGDESKDYYLTPGVYYLKFDNLLEKGSYSATTTFQSANKSYEADNDSINKIRNGEAIALSKTINGFIAQTKEDEYYKLKLPASGRLSLKMHFDVEKIEFCLYDSNDERLDFAFITQGDETLKYDLAPGVYYLAFKEFSGYGTYSFKAGFTDAKETYTYNNNSINMIRNRKAAPLSKKIRGQIALNDTVDYYKFYVPKTGNYSIIINSKVDVLFCNLYDSNNESVEDMSHYIGQRTYKFPLRKGTYYLELNNSVKTGNYSVIFRPASVSLKSVTAATGSFKAEWKKGTCSGYQLQYSTSSDFSKNSKKKTVSRAAKTHIKIKNLKKGKRYYVRIRTYVKYNGKKYYSAWSKVRSVKTKK